MPAGCIKMFNFECEYFPIVIVPELLRKENYDSNAWLQKISIFTHLGYEAD